MGPPATRSALYSVQQVQDTVTILNNNAAQPITRLFWLRHQSVHWTASVYLILSSMLYWPGVVGGVDTEKKRRRNDRVARKKCTTGTRYGTFRDDDDHTFLCVFLFLLSSRKLFFMVFHRLYTMACFVGRTYVRSNLPATYTLASSISR